MTYTRDQLISALQHEYDVLTHDDYDPDTDMSLDEYAAHLNTLSISELVAETSTDNIYTLDEYMFNHS